VHSDLAKKLILKAQKTDSPPFSFPFIISATGMTAISANAAESATSALTNRQRFLAACRCQAVDRPPVWLMRQAGRALPEYRKLKEKHSFLGMVRTPELAAEITLQPIRRFDFDAAILFSDILITAEGLGQGYRFRDGGGIVMDFELRTTDDIRNLDVAAVQDRLAYVPDALELVRSSLGDKTALIGFAGSPWTLANFMLEGGSAQEFTQAKKLFYSEPDIFSMLMKKLTAAVTRLLQMQIVAGVDAVQIFDSLGGLLSSDAFASASANSIKQIISALNNAVPVIVFSKDVHGNWQTLVDTGANILGVDCHVRLADVRSQLPANVGVQGNLDPFLLMTTPEVVTADTNRILNEMRDKPGHIFNLGHGVPPEAKLENIGALVETVRNFK
jgi:uroporphyrinogen decarboxylase